MERGTVDVELSFLLLDCGHWHWLWAWGGTEEFSPNVCHESQEEAYEQAILWAKKYGPDELKRLVFPVTHDTTIN